MSDAPARRLLSSFAEQGAVDVTCHVGQWPFRLEASVDVDGLRAYARTHGLRTIWVSHLAALFGFDTRTGNEACLRACAHDSLFRVFAVLDPTDETWEEELTWALSEGAVGVRIAPGFHGYRLPRAAPLAQACRKRGVPLQVLVRLDDARVRHPRFLLTDPREEEIASFLRVASGTAIVLSGLRWDEWRGVLPHLADAPPDGVLLDLWHVNGPFRVTDAIGDEPYRWVFGSGMPVQAPEPTMLQIAASDLPAAACAAITGGNAHSMLRDVLSASTTREAAFVTPG